MSGPTDAVNSYFLAKDWCTPDEVISTMPRINGLAAVEQYLKENRLDSTA